MISEIRAHFKITAIGKREEETTSNRGEAAVVQGGSNMTGTDLCVNKPHCAAAVRP